MSRHIGRSYLPRGKIQRKSQDKFRYKSQYKSRYTSCSGVLVGSLKRQRTQRASPGKPRLRIYDYADDRVPMLKAMAVKRMRAYKAMGIEVADDGQDLLFSQAPGKPSAGT